MAHEKKVVLITGGSQGLGKDLAVRLLAQYEVVVLSNDKVSLEKTAEELKCHAYLCDITDVSSVQKTVQEIVGKLGHIDVLINDAGVWVGGDLDENDYSDIARVMLVNSVGTINITKAVVRVMKKQRSGKIINIGSIDGIETKAERSIYSASKWAITGFTKALAKDMEKYNVAVIGIYPGLIDTGLFANSGAERDMTFAMKPVQVSKIVEFILSFDDIVFDQVVFRNLHFKV